MTTFKVIFIDGDTDIVIPQLQRDYIQGQREDILSPLLSSLVDAITDTSKKEVHLNYIYGYGTKDNGRSGFIPVDGQQRLTTLWLLHLYVYSKYFPKEAFNVNLLFRAREYAGRFTCELKKHINELVNSKENSIKEAITKASWFIAEWKYDKTVDSMIKTLSIIDNRLKNTTREVFNPEGFSRLNRISFQFLNMEELGLTDDIYVKMNGRGKPLTYFENLKSWMDSYGDNEWKSRIDNEWASFFWKNRNKNQMHPEEIDDEQQRLFYTLSLIYWLQNKNDMLSDIKVDSDSFFETINYLRSLPTGYSDSASLSEKPSLEDIKLKIINILRVGKLAIPLYWIENWGIFSEKVIEWIKTSLDTLTEINDVVESQSSLIYFNFDHTEHTSLVYDIAMDNAYYDSTIPLLYGLIKTPENCKKEIHQWLRLLRNLVLNSSIGYDRIVKAFSSIDLLSELIASSIDTSPVLSTLLCIEQEWNKYESKDGPFTKQMKEECEKAKIANQEELSIVEEIENMHTMRGRVSFIFDFLQGEEWTIDSLKSYRDILSILFPDSKKNKTGFKDNLVRRVLMTYEPHKIGNDSGGGKWKHIGNGSEDWKNFLCNRDSNKCVKSMIENIRESVCEISHSGVEKYLKSIADEGEFDFTEYWHLFVQFSGVWSFMEDKLSSTFDEKNNYKIILLKKTRFGDGYDHAELRAYSLFLYLNNNVELKNKFQNKGWNGPHFWYRGNWDSVKDTCVFFEKIDEDGNKIAVDVYFRKTKADDFCIDLLLRPKDNTEEDIKTTERIKEYFGNKEEYKDLLSKYEFCDRCCYTLNETKSWKEIIKELQRIIECL